MISSAWFSGILHFCVVLVFIFGLSCFFIRKSIIRQVVGLKLMLQSISLGLIITGWEIDAKNLSQAMVISALVLEAVVISLALTMIIRMTKHTRTKSGNATEEVPILQWNGDG